MAFDLFVTGQSKLHDAHCAGGPASERCTLILTEGDSAKSLVISGFSVIGQEHYGAFPLRQALVPLRSNPEPLLHSKA